jgi:hypothetical protein
MAVHELAGGVESGENRRHHLVHLQASNRYVRSTPFRGSQNEVSIEPY